MAIAYTRGGNPLDRETIDLDAERRGHRRSRDRLKMTPVVSAL
jgi:hypothetical protein